MIVGGSQIREMKRVVPIAEDPGVRIEYEYSADVVYQVQEARVSVTGLDLTRFGNRVPEFQELIAALAH
jgi:hypothetical protein